MKYALVNISNIVVNVIAYNPNSEYTPPSGLTVESVNDWVEIGDAVSMPEPTPPSPAPQQTAANAIAAGIALTSTGTPALNGQYPCDATAQAKVNGVVTCIVVNGTFPNGASTLNWYDTSGVAHVFPDVTTFKNFANAFINFVALVTEYSDSNGAAGSIPSNAITIS